MEEKRANGGGFGFPNPLCQPLRHVSEDDTPIDLPASIQHSKDCVSDRDRHPGWLVRVDDRDQKLEESSLPVVQTIAHGIPILGVDLVHEAPFVVALHPVGQLGTSSQKVVGVAPQVRGPKLWAIPDRSVKNIGSLRLHHLPDQLLPLQCPWALQ